MTYSIITPVYNRQDCISRCIESVIRNLTKDIVVEHIIVDDGSVDRTPDIVQEYADQYSHIKFVRFDRNRGTNAARNAAVKVASGDYCIILDSDDYFREDAIKNINKIVSTYRFLHYFFLPDDMVSIHQKSPLLKDKERTVLKYEDLLLDRVNGDFVHVISTKILKDNPFDEYLRINEGVFFMRFHKEEREVLYSNIIVTKRDRNRSDSVSLLSSRANKMDLRRTVKAISYRIEWFGDDLLQYQQGKIKLQKLLHKSFDYNLLLSDYKNARENMNYIIKKDLEKPSNLLYLIFYLHLGEIYFVLCCMLLKLKTRMK